MPEGLFEFALKLLEQALKFLKFLPIPPKVVASVSLLPPLIGAAQVSWKFLRAFSSEHKKKVLRERILGLENFLKLSTDPELSQEQSEAIQDARREKALALSQLARLASAIAEGVGAVVELSRKRSWIRRTLLLYSPKPGTVWILHALFYFFSIELLSITLVLGAEAAGGHLGIAVGLVTPVAMFAVPVLVFWGLAVDLDRSGVRSRSRLQRALLLYTPEKRWRWVWYVLFYISLLAVVAVLGLLPEAIQSKEIADTLIPASVWLVLALIFRGAAVRSDRGERKLGFLSRSFLLYAPRKRWAWLLHVLFWLELCAVVAILMVMVPATVAGESVASDDIEVLLFTLIFLFVFWGFASHLEQGRPQPPSILRRLFLLYLPGRKLLWTLQVVFYLSVMIALQGLIEVATGQLVVQTVHTTTGQAIRTTSVGTIAPVFYFALVALLSRALAVSLEPWATAMPRWIAWLWLGRLPQGWLKRSGFLLSSLVFYASIALWPLLILMAIDDLRAHAPKTILIVTLPIIAAGFAGRWIARRLQARQFEGKAASMDPPLPQKF